jgi:hypothetical protein
MKIILLIIAWVSFASTIVFQQVVAGLGPILAYALTLLDGKSGLAGWRWIFVSCQYQHNTILLLFPQIIEGLITMFLGAVMWFLIPDFPDRNEFLTPKQTALVLKRIEDDRGDSIPDPITVQKVKQHLSDWTIWSGGEHSFPNAVHKLELTTNSSRYHVSMFHNACL